MSMPGFVFHFHCDSCQANSGDYSVYAFSDIFNSCITLPAWSIEHKCWASFRADLSPDQRRAMEADHDILFAFAESLSSDKLTVAVARMSGGASGSLTVNVIPEPTCPYCGIACQSRFGYPPRLEAQEPPQVSIAEFLAFPISIVDLSVRARRICQELGVESIGEMENARARIAAHPRATETTILEIDALLAHKPADTQEPGDSPRG